MEIPNQVVKNQIRQQMKTRLTNLTREEYQAANLKIQAEIWQLDVVKRSQIIMIYYAIHREIETIPLITEGLLRSKTLTLPVCTPAKNLKACVINNLNELVPGIFGLHQPGPLAPEIKPKNLDLIVVPGLAFDQKGFRLGHGAGYYDRFLADTQGYKLGLAYDFQIIEQLPAESHDQPMDGVLTPSGFLSFHTSSEIEN